MALVASKPGEQTVSSSSTTSSINAMSSSASEPLTISSPSQVTQSPPVRKVNQRLVANKSALRLLSKTINLGKSRLVHNEILEPKVREAKRLVPPMRRFWEDARNKQVRSSATRFAGWNTELTFLCRKPSSPVREAHSNCFRKQDVGVIINTRSTFPIRVCQTFRYSIPEASSRCCQQSFP